MQGTCKDPIFSNDYFWGPSRSETCEVSSVIEKNSFLLGPEQAGV